MGIRNRLARVAAVSLVGGAVVAGGLGFAATASADDGRQPGSNQGAAIQTNAGPGTQWPGQGQAAGGQSNAAVDASFVKTNLKAVAAKQIGISEDALTREMAQGRSIAQVAAQHGVAYATVKTTLVNAEDADLQAATAAGTVSQAQANQLVSQIPHMVEAFLARSSGRSGLGPVAGGQPAGRPATQLNRPAMPSR